MVNNVLFSSRCEEAIQKRQLEQLQKSLKVILIIFKIIFIMHKVIEELDEQMTITAGGRLERRSEKPNVRTVFPPQPPVPNDSESSNLSNITYTEVLSVNDDLGYQAESKQEDTLIRSDSDSSNHHTPSTSSLLFVVEPVVSEGLNTPNSRTSSVTYDYETSRRTPDHHD